MLCGYFAEKKFLFLLGKRDDANAPVACKKWYFGVYDGVY
jgi:hypothetical protein